MKQAWHQLAVATLAATALQPAAAAADLRDLPITRTGSALYLNGTRWRAVGPNVYWLGLDENVIPPAGEPFYAPFNASYPTRGRITEVMAVCRALGATMIRAHTLGVSTGNPLSLWPAARSRNDKAFEIIDFAVAAARERGIRLMVPLTDNYVSRSGRNDRGRFGSLAVADVSLSYRTTTTEARYDFSNLICCT